MEGFERLSRALREHAVVCQGMLLKLGMATPPPAGSERAKKWDRMAELIEQATASLRELGEVLDAQPK